MLRVAQGGAAARRLLSSGPLALGRAAGTHHAAQGRRRPSPSLGVARASTSRIASVSSSAASGDEPSSSGSSSGGGGGGGDGGEFVTNHSAIFLRRLPRSYDALLVGDLCRPFGAVESVRVNYFQNSRESKGSAHVAFSDEAGARDAVAALDGSVVEGARQPIEVDFRKRRKELYLERGWS